jgi:uncharacterized protein (DUF1015 family)
MADVRPFRALRFDPKRVDPALTIAPPYDVISADEQAALYRRSEHNIVRIEYGEQRPDDTSADSRYTRAARDLDAWRRDGVLMRDAAPAVYAYTQEFEWEGQRHARRHLFAAVRLEEWEKGIIKPHEHTLSGPKADRLELLRATRTQVSPVYCLYRPKAAGAPLAAPDGTPLYDFTADGQHHSVSAITGVDALSALHDHLDRCDVYIADGHHRYETALVYRDECRARASSWTGDEPESFVLMALTDAADPGLLVLPTHRIVNPPSFPADAVARVARHFRVEDVTPAGRDAATARLHGARGETAFLAAGIEPGRLHLLTLADRGGIEALMPSAEPAAWKRLDVSVLQHGILREVFGIDDAALTAGGAVSYTQVASEALAAVEKGRARLAFLLNATPVDQILAVADAGGRMPQKSTYFYPKLPTGLVLRPLEP